MLGYHPGHAPVLHLEPHLAGSRVKLRNTKTRITCPAHTRAPGPSPGVGWVWPSSWFSHTLPPASRHGLWLQRPQSLNLKCIQLKTLTTQAWELAPVRVPPRAGRVAHPSPQRLHGVLSCTTGARSGLVLRSVATSQKSHSVRVERSGVTPCGQPDLLAQQGPHLATRSYTSPRRNGESNRNSALKRVCP